MTEYWKSQARKYCDFCKCWFADNKVSISFHESGKRHKENVKKHISKLSKKSVKEFKQQGKIDDDMKKMEKAAMAAYLKDVQNNADLTSQTINGMLENSGSSSNNLTVGGQELPKPDSVWQEVKTDDGSSYYWNKDTDTTTWDAPDNFIAAAKPEKKIDYKKEEKRKKKLDEEKEALKEAKASKARESMRERAVKEEKQPTSTFLGPAPRGAPYGSWKTVDTKPTEPLDFQLPKKKELPPPPVIMEPERFQFGEKRVESLGDGPVEFKKRKFNSAKRNMRQKVDDD